MADSQFNVEGATNGLVLALFLVAALFLGVMLVYVLRDIDTRRSTPAPGDSPSGSTPSSGATSAVTHRAPPPDDARFNRTRAERVRLLSGMSLA